ncbi:DUF3667 domain-containing protein [Mesohalobacter salilacus]|uniref:DUF3667 domain-containing protein n=1 Tax=Mesohalobacter salilacus TaxID=2491711 RepID=UPI0026B038AB
MNSVRKYRSQKCLNCNHDLDYSDRFCPYCGQRNSNEKLSLFNLLSEYFSGVFAYDSKLFSSIKLIVTSPGKLSIEFLSGKRVRYVNPFRFFISVSIVFFILISVLPNIDIDNLNGVINTSEGLSDSLSGKGDNEIPKAVFEELNSNHYLDFDEARKKFNLKDNFNVELKFLYIRAMYKMTHEPQAFTSYIYSKLPFFIFFFVPIFTLFSKLLYIRQKFSYTDHLVLNYNLNTVFFIILIFNVLLMSIFDLSWTKVFMFLFFVYLLIATKRFYGQGYIKTFFKTSLSIFLFILSSFIVIFMMLAISILFF